MPSSCAWGRFIATPISTRQGCSRLTSAFVPRPTSSSQASFVVWKDTWSASPLASLLERRWLSSWQGLPSRRPRAPRRSGRCSTILRTPTPATFSLLTLPSICFRPWRTYPEPSRVTVVPGARDNVREPLPTSRSGSTNLVTLSFRAKRGISLRVFLRQTRARFLASLGMTGQKRILGMDELIERYVNYLRYERNASPHTVRNYRSDLLQFRDYLAEGRPTAAVDVRSVDALRIRGFLSALFERQEKKSSIARKLSAVRAFFKFLKREGVLAENPSTLVSTPKQDKILPRIMTEEEMITFLDAVAEATKTGEPAMRRDRALLEMLYASGLRVSELVGLDLRSVNFGDCMVLVRGKGRKERIVPFGSKAKQALEDYLPLRQRVLLERKKSGQQALFLNVWGERLTTRSVDRLV